MLIFEIRLSQDYKVHMYLHCPTSVFLSFINMLPFDSSSASSSSLNYIFTTLAPSSDHPIKMFFIA